MKSTRVSEFLGIRHPIIVGAMGHISGTELVVAAAEAGGLGILVADIGIP